KKVFSVKGKPILVINDNGFFYATSGICSHYNFSLENGIYSQGKIRCPLHGACFNVKTGDIEDFPGFDSLNTYDVKEVDGNLVLNTTEQQLANSRRTRKSNLHVPNNDAPIIVIGGGISAATFVEQVRLNGCAAPITIITEEELPPYDRVQLSKKPTAEGKELRLRSDEFYKENFINVITNATGPGVISITLSPSITPPKWQQANPVTGVDFSIRKVKLWTGDTMQYSKLVLALGGAPRKLTCPGADLKNVHTLRVASDANTIAAESVGKHVVCIGGSFIGMEIASALMGTAASVTVVCNTDEPLPALGPDIGCVIRN
ncbi:rieske [2Fe-2S] domain protein, partial [Necator americanus]